VTSAGGILTEAGHIVACVVANICGNVGIVGNRRVEEGFDLDRPGAFKLGEAREVELDTRG